MRVYYDLILWDEVDDNDPEKLKTKFAEMGNRFKGYGVLKFEMRAAQTQIQAQPQPPQPQQQEQQPQPQQEEQYEEQPQEDETVVDE